MGKGAKLQQTAPLKLWNEDYKLVLRFTMPENLDEIGEYDGLLGSEKGGHPYPFFNRNGFYYEKQNGPHPRKAVFGLHLFKARKSYEIAIEHFQDKLEGDCFAMHLSCKCCMSCQQAHHFIRPAPIIKCSLKGYSMYASPKLS